ncbi:MAG: type secretion system tip protein VgrG [Pseudomonadota bacterium]
MMLSQHQRLASVLLPAAAGPLMLYRVNAEEPIGRLFEYTVELLSQTNTVDLKTLLGKSVTIKLELEAGGYRFFNGIATRASFLGMLGDLYHYRILVHPKLWLLTKASNCRVLSQPAQAKTVPEMVKSILSEHGYDDVSLSLSQTYLPRDYCVQYRESDFDFISRLMEEEGIYYYFTHAESSHTLVLCDGLAAHKTNPGNANIRYFPLANQDRRQYPHVYDWCLSQQIQSGSYQLNDYHFETPKADLKTQAKLQGEHAESAKAVYDYPGEYTKHAEGDRYAKIRVEEMRAAFEQIHAKGNARHLATGFKFKLTHFPRADQNRDYLILSTRIQIQNNDYESHGIADAAEPFECEYTVLSSEFTYRPPRLTPAPVVQGLQTALVVGPSGEEIYTDKYGRIKVQFHWDRLGGKNENSSCWVRVAQVWAGKSWGGIFIPRIGQEVIVDFLEGNPDNPIVTGSVYNAEQMPPYELNANKTQSGIKTRSSQKGSAENFNELRFEDKKGEEEIYVHAEKNFTRIVENDDVHKIGFDKKSPGDQKVDIYNHRKVTLDQGNDELTVKMGNRKATINQGNDDLMVKMGNRTVKVDLGKINEEAMQAIELKVGQSSIKIDQTGVTIKGMMIKIEGQMQTDVKGLMTTVSGDAMMTVKGGLVMIN